MSRWRRKECCIWWDVWHGQRGGAIVNETHSCHVCTIVAPRFLAWMSDWENCGATHWDKENRRKNKVSFNICLMCLWASKREIPIRKLNMQVWNLREESQKHKSCAKTKQIKFFGKVLVPNSLTWDENHLITLAFIVLKSSDQISLLTQRNKNQHLWIWHKTAKEKLP